MPTPRRQIIQDPINWAVEGRHTAGRSARYIQIYINDIFTGGATNVSWDESNGSHFMAQIGNDSLEVVPGVRSVSGQISRWQIRGKDFRQMMAQLYGTVGDIDFRELPFDMRLHFIYTSPQGGTAQGGNTYEDAWWILHDCIVTSYGFRVPDQTSLLEDSVSFICKAVESWDEEGSHLGAAGYLYGTPSQFNYNATPAGQVV